MQVSAGKFWSIRRLADRDGRFKMVAADQRPPIMGLICKRKAVDQASYDDIAVIKETLTRNLAADSSAMLLDPIWAYPRSIVHVQASQGLLVTLENHEFEDQPGGRFSREIGGWDVAKIKRLGADGVKVLAWYRPDAAPEVLSHQQNFVKRIGQACRKHDICFLLELLVYPFAGGSGRSRDDIDHVEKRPQLVIDSVKTFADPKFGVDIFKLENPLAGGQIPDPDGGDAVASQIWFDRLGEAAARPWVMLSAGADMETFRKILIHAYRAGASGYLAGRAIWWQAAQYFPDLASMDQALKESALPYLRDINRLTDEFAASWHTHPKFGTGVELAECGPKFATGYGTAA